MLLSRCLLGSAEPVVHSPTQNLSGPNVPSCVRYILPEFYSFLSKWVGPFSCVDASGFPPKTDEHNVSSICGGANSCFITQSARSFADWLIRREAVIQFPGSLKMLQRALKSLPEFHYANANGSELSWDRRGAHFNEVRWSVQRLIKPLRIDWGWSTEILLIFGSGTGWKAKSTADLVAKGQRPFLFFISRTNWTMSRNMLMDDGYLRAGI